MTPFRLWIIFWGTNFWFPLTIWKWRLFPGEARFLSLEWYGVSVGERSFGTSHPLHLFCQFLSDWLFLDGFCLYCCFGASNPLSTSNAVKNNDSSWFWPQNFLPSENVSRQLGEMVDTTDLKSFDLRSCQFESGSRQNPESHEKYRVGASQKDWACS